jgi:hypothetical protein
MTRGLVLDPRGVRSTKESAGSLPEGGLRLDGLRIGIRHDGAWRSWTCVSEEWASQLSEAGAAVHFWRSGSRVGEEAARLEDEQQRFYEASELVIAGLCNCGSCTMQTVRDAVGAVERGIPAVVVATGHFEGLARRLAQDWGHPDLPMVALPYALETRPLDEVLVVARDFYDTLLRSVNAT